MNDDQAPPEDEYADNVRWSKLAEQSVLGGMMLKPAVIDEVMEVLVPSDFWDPRHELIARAIVSLHTTNRPVDAITVGEELRRREQLTRAGGDFYMHELTSIPPTAANAAYYAETVADTAVMRRLAAAGTRINAMGHATEGSRSTLIENARHELDLVESRERKPLAAIGATFMEVLEDLESTPTYLPTPWESLDKLIGGFAAGALYVIAARPGSGKSIAALQIAAKLAHHGVVAFSSLEMTSNELQLRLIAQYGPVHMTQLRNHTLNSDDRKRIGEASLRVKDAPIFVDDTAGVTIAQIRAHARAVARRGKLAGVIVDYLQLVRGEGESRQQEVSGVSQQLKQLAKDLNVPVIAAAQLKRAGMGRGRQLPGLDDLRESGAIEQDADCVMLLDRDRDKKPDDLTVIVAKNRHGESGKFTLQWQAQFARLLDKQWTPTALFEEREI